MNLFKQLDVVHKSKFRVIAEEIPRSKSNPTNKPWLSRQRKADELFCNAFSEEKRTTSQVANSVGRTHMSVLNHLYKLEARGLIKRVGEEPRDMKHCKVPGRSQIIWLWVGH